MSKKSRAEQDADAFGDVLTSAMASRGGVVAVPAPAAPEPSPGQEPPGLSRAERLAQLEDSVRQSVMARLRADARFYREVGPVLEEIREERLYEERGYEHFLDYVDNDLPISRSHVYRYIDLGRVCLALAPMGEKALEALTAQTHAEELLPALKDHGDDAARRIWAQVTADPSQKVTAERIARTRDALGLGRRTELEDGGGEVVEGELVDEDGAAAAQHAAGEHTNRELHVLAEDLERLGRRLDRIIEQGAPPLDHGAALHDVNRIRKAGRLFNKKADVPGLRTVDAEAVEE